MEEILQVFIDKTKIAEYEKAIPSSLLFNAISFDCCGNTGENDKFYIINIKIKKGQKSLFYRIEYKYC